MTIKHTRITVEHGGEKGIQVLSTTYEEKKL